jgi:hypothetical protein
VQYVIQGLVGAVLGAVLYMVIAFYADGAVDPTFAVVLMAVCFALGALLGERGLEWLKNVIQYIW